MLKAIFYSPLLDGKNHSRTIAYLGLMTAFSVISNSLFEFKMMDTQFSLTIAVSLLIGALIGGGYGFIACFLGDLVGFLINSGGFTYMPWVGLTTGVTALFGGLFLSSNEGKGSILKTILACLCSFLVGSVLISTTAFYFLYSDGVSYWTYFISRFFIKGQIYNCLFNYAVAIFILPIIQTVIKKAS